MGRAGKLPLGHYRGLAGSEVSLNLLPHGLVEGLLFLCVLVSVHNSVIYMYSVEVGTRNRYIEKK